MEEPELFIEVMRRVAAENTLLILKMNQITV